MCGSLAPRWRRLRTRNSSAQVHDVDVSAEPDVIRQIPAGMIGIVVDHDGIRIPEPAVHVADVERRDAEVPVIEEEAIRTAAREMINVVAPKRAGKVPVFI